MSPVQGQFIAVLVKSLAKTRDIPVPEDGKTASAEANLTAIGFDILVCQKSDDCLSRRQTNTVCFGTHAFPTIDSLRNSPDLVP